MQWGPTKCSFSLSLRDPSVHLLSGDLAMAWDQPDKDPPLPKDKRYSVVHTFKMHMYITHSTGRCQWKVTDFPKLWAMKEQANGGFLYYAPKRNVLDLNSLKSGPGFWVIEHSEKFDYFMWNDGNVMELCLHYSYIIQSVLLYACH